MEGSLPEGNPFLISHRPRFQRLRSVALSMSANDIPMAPGPKGNSGQGQSKGPFPSSNRLKPGVSLERTAGQKRSRG